MRFAPPKFNLGPLRFVNIEINPNPEYKRSIARSQRLSPTQEPVVFPLYIANPKRYVARTPSAETIRPDSARFIMIIWVQQGKVRIPFSAEIDSKTKRMVIG